MSRAAPAPSGWIRDALAAGFAALNAGRPADTAAACRRVLAAAPELAEAHFLVGLAALALDDRRTAVSAFGSVARLRPQHSAAWAQLARLFAQTGRVGRAQAALAEAARSETAAISAGAGDAQVQELIGTACSLLGDQHAARDWYARAVASAPDAAGHRVNLANALVFLGDTAAAEAELVRALDARPEDAQAHWLLSGVRTARDRAHVETLVRLIARGGPPRARAFLYYALGKELEDLEEWPRAFAAFARGAAIRRGTLAYDEAAEARLYATLDRRFTPEWLATRSAGEPDGSAVFVVGQPRTGTTLVERILAAHPLVHGAGELQHFGLAVRRLTNHQGTARFSAELMEAAAGVEPRLLGRAYLAGVARVRGERPRFVDKLPSNYLYLPLILAALPNARVVHVVRDPMDACFASFKQLFADAYPHSYDQQEMARHYVRYHRLMAQWRERFPGRVVDVRYEALVHDLERETRTLLERLGLPWSDACLAFHRAPGAVATASAVQVREPAHTRSVGRWRRYERELAPMRAVLAAHGIGASVAEPQPLW